MRPAPCLLLRGAVPRTSGVHCDSRSSFLPWVRSHGWVTVTVHVSVVVKAE
jgi:hypothetical protein